MLQRSVLNQAVALAVVAMLQGLLCCAAWHAPLSLQPI